MADLFGKTGFMSGGSGGGGGAEAIGNVLGGFLGGQAGAGDRASQAASIKSLVAQYKAMGYPPDYAKALILQQFQEVGIYTPELEQDLNDTLAESEVGQISEDPATRQAQMTALSAMQQRGKVGLSAEDRAALNQIRQQVQIDSQAKQAQIVQDMKQRGQGGSGAEQAARLLEAQSAADRASSQSDTQAAQAQAQALQAVKESASMAGNIRTQDFSNKEIAARAKDERNRFMNENSIARQRANVAAQNLAKQKEYETAKEVGYKNTTAQQDEAKRQAQAKQDIYRDKLAYTQGITGQIGTQANYQGQQAQQKTDAMGNLIGGIGQVAGIASMFSDEMLKENVDYTDDSVQQWLDGLSKKILRK